MTKLEPKLPQKALLAWPREAEIAGIDLALELLNSKVDHPDYQADHTAWGLHEDQELYTRQF
jgi:hypothetical protein